MEVKINKDIREFSESIFFGLSLRQFIFSALACIVSVILYFSLKPFFGIETLSWICILGAVPFALMGFVKYNGMTAEKLVIAFIKTEFLIPKTLTFKAKNIYFEIFKDIIERNLGIGKKRKNKKKIKRKDRNKGGKIIEDTK